MCGIGGFYNCTGGRTPVKALKSLWRGLEGRGTHAAGFALQWVSADKPVVLKQAGPGHRMHKRLSKFIGTGETTQYVMLHTRFTTQGSTANNANNHPVVSQGMIVTHNGVLYNDSDVLARLGVTPVAEVDTEAINAGLARESPGWVLDEVDGSMSVAWVDSTKPDFVNLMTNGENPLVIARTKTGDVVWSSTKSILDASKFKVKSFFHAQPFKVYTICPDGTIRSKVVSEQRAEPNYGRMGHRASRPAWMQGTSAKAARGSQIGRKASRKATPVTVEVPGTISEDELDAVGLDGYDWDEYMIEVGYSRVWKRNQWVWVPASEVSL